jgi:D-alanyl-D-alanine dipeptidase
MTSYETVDELKGIPIEDNGEPLVDFEKAGLRFAKQHPVFPFPRVHLLRRSVVERLLEAQERLPADWTLVLVEGFRALEVQRMQHEANRRRFEALFPDLSESALQALLEDFSAPPDVPAVPPPHSTGGALDLHLLDPNGEEVDLISPFPMDNPEMAAWDAPVSETARRNRETLKAALESAGITNYPGEFWHWSYGDQGWAHRGGHPCALYGRLTYTVAEAEAIQGEPANRQPPLRPWPVPLPEEEVLRDQ